MAIDATEILLRHPHEHHLDRAACAALARGAKYLRNAEASWRLDRDPRPKIIVAASGMATGGRVLHHLAHLAPDPRNTILFTGFQAGGTRGDRILRGEEAVKIYGELVPVRAEVAELGNSSAHADYAEILDWLAGIRTPPRAVYVTHGEPAAAEALAGRIAARFDWPVTVPEYLDQVEL